MSGGASKRQAGWVYLKKIKKDIFKFKGGLKIFFLGKGGGKGVNLGGSEIEMGDGIPKNTMFLFNTGDSKDSLGRQGVIFIPRERIQPLTEVQLLNM